VKPGAKQCTAAHVPTSQAHPAKAARKVETPLRGRTTPTLKSSDNLTVCADRLAMLVKGKESILGELSVSLL